MHEDALDSRQYHNVVVIGSNIMVVGGVTDMTRSGQELVKTPVSIESCQLSNGQFSCIAFDSTFTDCIMPLLYIVDDTYEQC